ncbi:MAG: threonine/serine exporter family protein [Actinomycetota bacterium]|nr:threonine/serine exporter family protein [Actinomycetota bacterium]
MGDTSRHASEPHQPGPPEPAPGNGRAGRDTHDHAWEDDLEPRHLINRCDAIVRVGAAMLASGTGCRRVDETISQVAHALDIDEVHTRISLTDLAVTVRQRSIIRTQLTAIPNPGVNADQIAALQRWAAGLPAHMTVQEVNDGLDEVLRRPKQWPAWAAPVGAGIACAAFAFLNNVRPAELGAVFAAAALGQTLRRALHHRHLNQIALAFLASVVACGGYLAASGALGELTSTSPAASGTGLVSSILFLVPGFPLMTAALDLARLDLLSGITRMVYAAMLTFAAGLGLWFTTSIIPVDAQAAALVELDATVLLALQAVASFVGVFGFAMVFNSPQRVAVVAGLMGMLANPIRILLIDHHAMAASNAAAIGTLLIGLLAFVAERYGGLPRIILSVPTVVIMVPGVAAFRALVAFDDGEILDAVDSGMAAITIAIGMAVGLIAARMLTDPRWSFSTPNPPSYSAAVRKLRPYRRRSRNGRREG